MPEVRTGPDQEGPGNDGSAAAARAAQAEQPTRLQNVRTRRNHRTVTVSGTVRPKKRRDITIVITRNHHVHTEHIRSGSKTGRFSFEVILPAHTAGGAIVEIHVAPVAGKYKHTSRTIKIK